MPRKRQEAPREGDPDTLWLLSGDHACSEQQTFSLNLILCMLCPVSIRQPAESHPPTLHYANLGQISAGSIQ